MKNLSKSYKILADLLKCNNLKDFENLLISFFKSFSAEALIIFKEDNNLYLPLFSSGYQFDSFLSRDDFDKFDDLFIGKVKFASFDEIIEGDLLIKIRYNVRTFFTVILKMKDYETINFFKDFISVFGYKYYELLAKESRLKAFVLFQQKIEFIKNADFILSILDENEVLVKSLSFFVDTFSAEAAFAKYGEDFIAIGLEEKDLDMILIDNVSLKEIIQNNRGTIFFDRGIVCEKFNISNLFLIFIDEFEIVVALFNIKYEFIPDKEFAEIISSILKIALKNAVRHREIINYKLQEQEIKYTGEILNKFSNQKIDYEDNIVKASGINKQARMAGGDFLDFKVNDCCYFSTLADVCGKGYSAAILTVALSTFIDVGADMVTFIEKLKKLNTVLCKKNLDGKFITAFFSYYNPHERLLKYISLGHEPAFLISDNECIELKSKYIPLGIFEEDYTFSECKIKPGDRLFIYSDGITEYIDYNEIKNRLLNQNKYDSDFPKKLYNEFVFDRNKQKDDFTCLYLLFK
ncbi:PP2C family protein-serine/threonine phosphatase [Deferribacter thermophilus]|uniref:PP2C family protein-serine/threonine phosphatase n=1 Tax=Deferribacter thermophilus TaxID=53573 RepID=UPI003C164D95